MRISEQLFANCNALNNLFYEFDITLHTTRLLNLWDDQNEDDYRPFWHMPDDNDPLFMRPKDV